MQISTKNTLFSIPSAIRQALVGDYLLINVNRIDWEHFQTFPISPTP